MAIERDGVKPLTDWRRYMGFIFLRKTRQKIFGFQAVCHKSLQFGMSSAVLTAAWLLSDTGVQNSWIIRRDTAAETAAASLNNCKNYAGWNNPAGMITDHSVEIKLICVFSKKFCLWEGRTRIHRNLMNVGMTQYYEIPITLFQIRKKFFKCCQLHLRKGFIIPAGMIERITAII